MFHAQRSATGEDDASAQTDNTSLADGNDSDDTGAPFDDTIDTKQYGRPRSIRSVFFVLYNVAGIASKL